LCFAYFMGWVTAMYLQEYKDRMEPSFRTWHHFSWSKRFLPFMEPKGLYPEPVKSSPRSHTVGICLRTVLIISPIQA
jgi:hypothetical protein